MIHIHFWQFFNKIEPVKDQDKSKTDIILIDSKCVESHDKIRRQGGNEQMLRAKRSRSKFTMISPTLEDTVQRLRKVVYLGIFTRKLGFFNIK